ncbi:MAG: hypothetical protein PHE67_07670 [Campylobacterales bacterium]|nr:hypothetical protein [Campylobacterales bacterium]
MSAIIFTKIMIWVFGFVALVAWMSYIGEKGTARKQESGKYLGTVIISLAAVVFSIVMHLSYKSDYESLVERFKKGDDIYCYSSSFDSKWEKVNKSGGWYLEDDVLKHKEKGLKFGINRCRESF